MQLQGSLISVPRATGLEEEEDGEADDESRHDQRQRRRRRRHAEVLRGEQRALMSAGTLRRTTRLCRTAK